MELCGPRIAIAPAMLRSSNFKIKHVMNATRRMRMFAAEGKAKREGTDGAAAEKEEEAPAPAAEPAVADPEELEQEEEEERLNLGLSDLKQMQVLGVGSFGMVRLCTRVGGSDDELYALKVREHSSVERCGSHVAISPATLRSSNSCMR